MAGDLGGFLTIRQSWTIVAVEMLGAWSFVDLE
jgi:hypothetical protein